ncbi:Rv1355c family protein [Nocardia sp. 348MFTsu5.1]|uniref:Rv1355c family protein n=1 Tax=Nocardia sp. 348MFTsu5.1 TaxID=1172185 RepID=UPI0003A3C3A7|nr:Rv1355c family protein [Nocardia sp. 348MFTsu5.1]
MNNQADESLAVVEVFDDQNPEGHSRLENLRATPGIDFLDAVDHQLSAVGELIPPLGQEIVDEPARWIYYPWRKKAIRLLGPVGYRRLRLDRNRNKLTVDEQDRAGVLRVGVVGLSVGHAVAHTLALEGLCGHLRLTDFDDIELSNLNRVPGSVFDIGLNKAVVAARRIAEIDPYLEVRVHQDGVQESTVDDFLSGLDIVIEECDSFDAKVLVRDRARALGIPVIMETSDGGVLDVERFDLEPDRPLFHGLLGDFDAASLSGLSAAEKVPFALQILDGDRLTARMAASVFEMGRTLSAWPQLGGDVALGGATVAAAVRRIVRGEPLPSGRIRVDLDSILDELAEPVPAAEPARRVAVDVRAEFAALDTRDAVVYAGSRAPSLGNAQPWRFDVDDTGVTAVPDVSLLSTMDVGGRASAVALGAVLHNMTIAASAAGVLGKTAITGTGLGVEVRLEYGSGGDLETAAQLGAMLDRRTNRGFGDRSELGDDVVSALSTGVSDGVRTRLITDPETLAAFGVIAGAAERLRYLDPDLQAEMMAEIVAASDAASDTGIEVGDLALMPQQAPLLALLRRPDVMAHLDAWGAGSALGADAQGRVMTSSGLAIVIIDNRNADAYVRGGIAMQDFWIRAQSLGLAVQPVTPPFLYAEGLDECFAVSASKGDELFGLAKQFDEVFGLKDGEAVAAVLRLSRSPFTPSVSRRRAVV